MEYTIEGKENEELLLFINGAGVSKWIWKYQRSLFSEYKCIFFDLPGHGDNSNIDFTSIDDVCLFIIDVIKKESKDSKAVVIGLSIGAQIVLNLLKSYSEYISKAVVISALNNPIKIYSFLLKPILIISKPFIKNKRFSKLQFRQFALPEDWFDYYYKDSLKISIETLKNITKENMEFNFEKIVTGIPTLVLVGEKEGKIMKKSAKKTCQYIKGSKYYIAKGAGHGIPYEIPEMFNELFISFISNNYIGGNK